MSWLNSNNSRESGHLAQLVDAARATRGERLSADSRSAILEESLKPEAGGKMSLVPGVAELLMDQFDVGQDAIVPFLWESCTRFLPMAESLVDQARTCLDEASALDRDREARR